VLACLELGDAERAARFTEQIKNWRRGACHAELASHFARRGDVDSAHGHLTRAKQIAGAVGLEEWRQQRIRGKVAAALVLLGEMQQATQLQAGLSTSDSLTVARTRVTQEDEDDFDRRVAALDKLLASEDFEVVQYALGVYAQLFGRYYADVDRRTLMESRIRGGWTKVAVYFRIRVLMSLIEFALNHDDRDNAMRLVNDGATLFDSARWEPRRQIILAARLASLRHRAGDGKTARTEADAALAMFNAQRDKIENFMRADALRPLAEAFHTMGDAKAALETYRRAVEEGAVNPNIRPRIEDFSETCTSMALAGVDPDEALWAELRRIRKELGAP